LQDAIEGKLTAKWRDKHPDLISGDNHASKLLEKIKAEKERLIKEGKINKDKPLAPITKAEKPFDLPDGWVWCRIGETGLVERGVTPEYCENSEKKILNQKCVRWNRIEVEWSKPVLPNWFNSLDKSSLTSAGHVLVNSTGEGTIGRAGVVNIGSEGLPFDTHVLRYRSIAGVVPVFLMYFINSSYGQNQVTKLKGAKTTKQTELGVNNLCVFLFPLPSLSEQQEIVMRVNKLMDMIDELEKQVSERKEQSEMLMQSVLREAFTKE